MCICACALYVNLCLFDDLIIDLSAILLIYVGNGGADGGGGEGGSSYAANPFFLVNASTGYQMGDGYVSISYLVTSDVKQSMPWDVLTFNCVGTTNSFVVPSGVSAIFVDMAGASGGADSDLSSYVPGRGARIKDKISGWTTECCKCYHLSTHTNVLVFVVL